MVVVDGGAVVVETGAVVVGGATAGEHAPTAMATPRNKAVVLRERVRRAKIREQ